MLGHGFRRLQLANNLLVVEHVVCGSGDLDRIEAQYDALLANERLSADDGGSADVAGASRPRSAGVLEAPPLVPVRDDLAVAQLNRALLLCRQHRPGPAAELLEGLVGCAEALAEGTAVRALTLLLDLLIEERQLPRAVAVLHTFERLLPQLAEPYAAADAGGGGEQHQPGSSAPSASASATGVATGAAAGHGRQRMLALPRVSRWDSGPMGRSRALLEQQARPPPAPDLKLLVRLYRSRLHALGHNTRAAKRELKAAAAAAGGGGAGGAGTGAGAGGRPQLQQQQKAQGQGRDREPAAAGASAAAAVVPLPAVLYNAGLQHLLLGQYAAARERFAAAAAHYVNTPLLWLRTAEAALGLYRQRQRQRREQEASQRGPQAEPTAAAAAAGRDGEEASPGSLLSEAVAALQTALQQLDAQSEAHEQWQSSSDKLEEGATQAAAGAPGPDGATAGAAGGGGGGSVESAAAAAGSTPDRGQVAAAAPGVAALGDFYLPLPPRIPEQQQAGEQQSQRPAGLANGAEEARPGGCAAAPPHHHPTNGSREAHGTDARAALSEELAVVRRAVLANLAYAQLQAQEWAAALGAAQALGAAAAAAEAAPESGAGGAGGSAAATGGGGAAAATATAAAAAAAAAASEYSFLATCYAAEALCQLEQPAEAVECLSLWLTAAQEREAAVAAAAASSASHFAAAAGPSAATFASPLAGSAGGPVGAAARDEVYPLGNAAALAALTGPAAVAATYTNLAALFAAQGETAQAVALVRRALALQPGHRPAGLLLVHCELLAGNTAAALALLRQAQPLPSSLRG
ncbi:hypothetical protein GPECTOR_2g971 [Gonium pectorale]|uniref:Uncharacterized protein n=1 Tax=Gonium pectorale TaxID=33097 RepID=A0A150H1S8_GONPE|nr:hypothetical protein GPECTOR_2g971 [Gonium pectorale]|eukprot:KXZ56089.1 hypothetical protein GPECTOR_2g971 [Gonium pectorale]